MAQLIGSRWKIARSLCEGGQARTFVVQDTKGDGQTEYVLKRLKNIARVDRFAREIEAVRNLSHPNIVKLIDFDLTENPPFLVTEYCKGRALSEATSFWTDAPGLAIKLFLEACEGVRYAHAQDIIHRDLKPDNVFLRTPTGPAVIGDFGICYVDDDGSRITSTEEAVGPRLFVAPELEDGRAQKVSKASDVYSLGKLLYWLLSGGRIFSREKHRDVSWDLKLPNADSLVGWNSLYMEHLNRVLDQMIVANPEDRLPVEGVQVLVRRAARLMEKEFTPIDPSLKQPCQYCGSGVYVLRASGHQMDDTGIQPIGNPDWRIFTCDECGHMQLFRVDHARRKQWWHQ